MLLTFALDRFILKNARYSVSCELAKSSYWRKVSGQDFVTTNLGAAAKFKALSDEKAKRVFKRTFAQNYSVPALPPLPFLDPHQLDGVRHILSRSRSYLAHAPGAGKTAEAIIASLLAEGAGQTLFIVPPSLTANWAREIVKFTAWRAMWPTVAVVPRSVKKDSIAWRADFIICPDSMLTQPWVLAKLISIPKKLIAVDEASRFKDPHAKRTIALFGGSFTIENKLFHSPGLIQDARHAVLLDGSPMPNRPIELWAPTYAMNPEAIGCMDYDDFGFRYGGATLNERGQWEYKHSSNETELRERLQKDFMHVVSEDQLSHPERRRSIVFMNQDPRDAAMKNWEKRNLLNLPASGIDESSSQGELASYRADLGLRKAPWILNYVRERLNTKKESILLFVWHRNVAEMLAHALNLSGFKTGLVIGGVNPTVREQIFDDFQKRKLQVIVGNISAMGRGHNLQRADRVIFGEFSWTDELNKQCEKRASRRGRAQAAFVRCEYIVAPGTLDERVMSAVFRKEKSVKKVIG